MKLQTTLLTQDITYNESTEAVSTLTLDPNKNITLTLNNQNLVISGKLISRPIWPAVHTIRFIGIDESKFVGGGEVVLDSDKGLWCMGNGQLDLQGEDKTRWTNAVGGIPAGATQFIVKDCNNWHPGDELVIARTAKGAVDDDLRIIKSIDLDKKIITVDKPLTYDHPMVNGMWTAEVLNLTSNLRIEGTPSGSAHIFIMSMMMQNIMYCQVRYMGPRKNTAGGPEKEPVKGRYGFHFHHCMDSNVGMCMEGNVARNCNNHSFVTHMSNRICWCDNIAYDVLETPYWSDMGDSTHGLEYDHNIAGKVSYVPGSMSLEDVTTPSFGAGGFILGMGDGNSCHDNVCFGIISNLGIDGVGAYQWRNNNESTWFFKNNIAHNCSSALDIWQNTAENHTLEDFEAYYCTSGGRLGAYANVYHYKDCVFYESPLLVKHGSLTSLRVRFEGITCINGGPGYGDYAGVNAGIIQTGSPVATIDDGQPPVLYRNCKFIGCKTDIAFVGGEQKHYGDIVDCNPNITVAGSEVVRVQFNGKAYQQTASGKKDIPLFAPTFWGTGDGVKVEYFSDTNFKNKVAELIQPQANFTEWQTLGGPHHSCPGSKYSVRVTGQWQPQYSDTYTFSYSMDAGGSIDAYIENNLIGRSFLAIAGKKYNFKLEFRSTGSQVAGFSWNANCPSMAAWHTGGETIPQSQLYSGVTTPPVNKPPVANAGPDITITLPTNSVTLNGSGSDSDGSIVAYKWTYVSGQTLSVNITNPNNAITGVTGLVAGGYIFQLTVTDNLGATATDTVNVTVKPAPDPNLPPTVKAVGKVTVVGNLTLDGSGSSDPEGGIILYQWTQVPTTAPTLTILNASQKIASVQNAPSGSYVFRLTVTDDKGAKSSVDVPVNF